LKVERYTEKADNYFDFFRVKWVTFRINPNDNRKTNEETFFLCLFFCQVNFTKEFSQEQFVLLGKNADLHI